jgi:hypothetical protein
MKGGGMSYSIKQPCSKCKKEIGCADGYVIRGAIQGIIHPMPSLWNTGPGMHLGSGTVTHDCSNFEDKTVQDVA